MIRVGSLAALIYRIWGLQPITASNTRNPTYVATTIDQPCIAMGVTEVQKEPYLAHLR